MHEAAALVAKMSLEALMLPLSVCTIHSFFESQVGYCETSTTGVFVCRFKPFLMQISSNAQKKLVRGKSVGRKGNSSHALGDKQFFSRPRCTPYPMLGQNSCLDIPLEDFLPCCLFLQGCLPFHGFSENIERLHISQIDSMPSSLINPPKFATFSSSRTSSFNASSFPKASR
jgi:hypothetical protein